MAIQQFSDLQGKLTAAKYLQKQVDDAGVALFPNAVKHVINAHGKFYGLRSKYDGRGNVRTPLKA